MMWYGRMTFLMKGSQPYGPDPWCEALISPYNAKIQTTQVPMLAKWIGDVQLGTRTGKDVWDRIYTVTSFFVGVADDLTPYEYMRVANDLLGTNFKLTDLDNKDNLLAVKAKLAELRFPQIYGGAGQSWAWTDQPYSPEVLDAVLDKNKGMRLMGQRFIPDSYMFQNLVFPEVLQYVGNPSVIPFTYARVSGDYDELAIRGYPRGLDVMALLGSDTAKSILINDGDTDYVNFWNKYEELEEEFGSFSVTKWNQNLYWGWLYTLKSLLEPAPEGYPNYTRTEAWRKKQLNTALASWVELRHDTILYAKQSYTASPKSGIPPLPEATGYVEPVPEFYQRLLALTGMTQQGLRDMNALSVGANSRLENFKTILNRLTDISQKELINLPLLREDYNFIGDIAKTLEKAVTGIEGEGINTVMVADVHTHPDEGKVVEEALGPIDLIIVAVRLSNGSVILTAGPVFSYYEFKHPLSDRLTDSSWRTLLNSTGKPDRPTWYQPLMKP